MRFARSQVTEAALESMKSQDLGMLGNEQPEQTGMRRHDVESLFHHS